MRVITTIRAEICDERLPGSATKLLTRDIAMFMIGEAVFRTSLFLKEIVMMKPVVPALASNKRYFPA
jgi:hypothetical protein